MRCLRFTPPMLSIPHLQGPANSVFNGQHQCPPDSITRIGHTILSSLAWQALRGACSCDTSPLQHSLDWLLSPHPASLRLHTVAAISFVMLILCVEPIFLARAVSGD